MENIVVYREVGRFAGWPANYGIWSWGDEIVVGFTVGYHKADAGFHTRDRDRPFTAMQARSLDGGHTWNVQQMPCRVPGGGGLSADEHLTERLKIGDPAQASDAPAPCPGEIAFDHPDFALMCGRSGLRAGAVSWFYLSDDRCRSWQGPYHLPTFGQPGIAARTDYVVLDAQSCILFLTAAKSDGGEGRVFCARTDDGGQSFRFISWIGPETGGYGIMPASLRLSKDRLLTAIRCKENGKNWIDLYASDDKGQSWQYFNRPVPNTGRGGNPPALLRLQDGRLCLIYGFRDAPFGIRARLSADDGASWSDPVILRDDGGCHDLGYVRAVQRPDGVVAAVYYFNDSPESERYIAATLWRP